MSPSTRENITATAMTPLALVFSFFPSLTRGSLAQTFPHHNREEVALDESRGFRYIARGMSKQLDPDWQKARIAARIIVKSRKRPLHARDRRLARWLAGQPGVTNRLIEQGVAYVVAPIRLINHEWVDRRLAA